MSTALSRFSQQHMDLQITRWAQPLIASFGEAKHNLLSVPETEKLLRHLFQEQYENYFCLVKSVLYPQASTGPHITISCPNGNTYITTSFSLRAATPLPWLQGSTGFNVYQQGCTRATQVLEALPERLLENYARIDQIAKALKDLSERCTEYSQARYLIHQWPGALKFLPEHIQKSLRAHSFKRKPPNKVKLLQPETLQTLAWMTVVQPLPA